MVFFFTGSFTVTTTPTLYGSVIPGNNNRTFQLTVTTPTDADLYLEIWGSTDSVSIPFLVSPSATTPITRNFVGQVPITVLEPMYQYQVRLWTNSTNGSKTVTINGCI
jgi:hypothetical protein